MVKVGGQKGQADQRGAQQEVLQGFQRPPVDHFLAPAGEGAFNAGELPIDLADVFAHHIDLGNVATAQAPLVGQADELQAHWVETHHLGRYGVDGHLVGAGQYAVLHVPAHGPGARSVPGKGAVHHGEETGVNLLLNRQQVHQGFVDHRVRPMALPVQQAAKGVLHRPGHRGEDMGFHGREMDDVSALEYLRYLNAFGEYIVQKSLV